MNFKTELNKLVPMEIVSRSTVLFDLRKSRAGLSKQSEKVHKMANSHFWGNESGLVRDNDAGGSGTFLGCNFVNVYHIASVAKGIWIASTRSLTPKQTRPIAKKYVDSSL